MAFGFGSDDFDTGPGSFGGFSGLGDAIGRDRGGGNGFGFGRPGFDAGPGSFGGVPGLGTAIGHDGGGSGGLEMIQRALLSMAPNVVSSVVPGPMGAFAGGAMRGALTPSTGSSPFGSAADIVRGMVPSLLGTAVGGPLGGFAGAALGGMMNQLAADPNASIGPSTPLGAGEEDPFVEAAEAEIRRDPPAILARTRRTKGRDEAERLRWKMILERARAAEKASRKAARRLRT